MIYKPFLHQNYVQCEIKVKDGGYCENMGYVK